MADATPNYQVEQMRLRSQILAQEAAIATQRLAIMEMADRKSRHLDNIAAAKRAIEEMQEKLKGLGEAHGELTEQQFERYEASLDPKE